MTRLRHATDGRCITLGATTVLGRSSKCDIVLTDPRASRQHATLLHDSSGWSVRDLSSGNGTWVDGVRLAPGARSALRADATIRFADDSWVLIGDGPPVAAATSGRTRVIARDGQLHLPDEESPSVTVLLDAQLGWCVDDGHTRPAGDGDVLIVEGRRWILELPPPTAYCDTRTTMGRPGAPRSIATLEDLRLAVSQDEETVEAELRFVAGDPITLGPQSFNYLLVVLGRARLADEDEAPIDRGWMYTDDVCRELAVHPERLNVEVYRCRKRLRKLGIEGAALLFERRPSTRQIRLTVDCVRVVPLA